MPADPVKEPRADARAAPAAHPEGERVISTRELLAGSPIGFTDRGLQELKGVTEPRRVYLVEPDERPSG